MTNLNTMKTVHMESKPAASADTRNAFAAPEFNREASWQNVRLLKQHYIQAMF